MTRSAPHDVVLRRQRRRDRHQRGGGSVWRALHALHARRTQRTRDARRKQLPLRLAVLVPAHNEEALIGKTLASLMTQTVPADRILVMADNCTDRTVEIARGFPGVEVYETVDNAARKSGALNQGYGLIREAAYVVQVDADTVFDEHFLHELVTSLERTPEAGALAARVGVQPFPGGGFLTWLLWILQRLEYYYYDSMKVGNRGSVWCVSGIGGIYRGAALAAVADGRKGPWDETSIVEDYALSLDIEEAGWRTGSAMRAFSWSDTMPTLRDLWRQRWRWNAGTFAEWQARPCTDAVRADRRTFNRGLVLVLVNPLALTLISLTVVMGIFAVSWWSFVIVGLFVSDRLYRLRYVPRKSPADFLIALLLVPELLYRFVLDANLLYARLRMALSRKGAAGLAW